MRNKSSIITAVCIVSLSLAPMVLARTKKAPDANASPGASATASPAKERAIPFYGMISAVDGRAKTFTIAGKEKSRIFKITDRTTLTKAGNAATMKDVVEKEEVRGSYWKNADGSLEAKNVKLGPLTEEEKKAEEARKARHAEKKKEKEAAPPATSPAPTP